ncbi:MAG: preprotein translocase subunit SecG [Candidatus Yanofskybacteria bacterium CG10_big_fil_rev_8_21_14_0_10_46_23]|uniref:Protein-export membrane protein SecG n=1 Tax=Candidatus Yanofskybacteria bacterium CG10_big_fil_rev_8_21_14_0_10_46_23 TaxID=1975098 RepID=A0A2H0R521_9BACT|nr:MAG: preprotein translocase subunit SecG [Candidatus Yanofskybacteria bacterium CG10_big_fil_rev_8_21_14_0_10_46_23]
MSIDIIQIVLSLILVISILLQQRGAGLGSALGGSSSDQSHNVRRGSEKFFFNITIVAAFLFIATAIIRVIA